MPYKDIEDRREQIRRWVQHNHERSLEIKRNWAKRNPEKRKAHVIVGNALRDGKLERSPCEVCGERAQAHHDDYSLPLEVRWLCPKHHAEHHKQAGCCR